MRDRLVRITIGVATLAIGASSGSLAFQQAGTGGGGVGNASGSPEAILSAPPTAANGTAALSGTVVDGASGRPLSNAMVTLGPPARVPSGRARGQITDSQGRFVFTDLPAFDDYRLSAVTLGYAQGQFGRAGTRIGVVDGQWLKDLRITLWRDSAISGVVTDELGDPVPGILVRVFGQFQVAGQPQLAAGPTARTDDRGAYRIPVLSPGRYLVAIPSVQSSVAAETGVATLAGMTPAMMATATSAGRAITFPDFIDVSRASQILVGRAPIPPPPVGGRLMTYPTIFHPNSSSPRSASVIAIERGQSRGSVDFRLQPVAGMQVSGMVEGPPNGLSNLTLRLLASGTEDLGVGSETATALVAGDGRFTFFNVPVGDYTIVARPSLTTYRMDGSSTSVSLFDRSRTIAPPPGFGVESSSGTHLAGPFSLESQVGRGGDVHGAQVAVAVGDADVTGVSVRLQTGARMTGRVVWESAPPTIAFSATAEPAGGEIGLGVPASRPSPDDLTHFTIDGLHAGDYILRVNNFGQPGTTKSIRWNGREYAHAPFTVQEGANIDDVVITFTAETATLTGSVHGTVGSASTDKVAIVFPAERERWTRYGLAPQRLRSGPIGPDGTVRIAGFPAGQYLAVVVDGDMVDTWQDPAFLAKAAASAARVTLEWGKTTNVVLPVVNLP